MPKSLKSLPKGEVKERNVDISDTTVLQALSGERDSHLRMIEQELDLRIGQTSSGLLVRGQDSNVDLASDLLAQLRDIIIAGEQIFPGDLARSLKLLSADQNLELKDLYREQVRVNGRVKSISPKTPNQKTYIDAIRANDAIFGVGPAGTGKTYLAMAMAVSALLRKQVRRIILCRPAVEAGERLGFLPGDMFEKVNPYLRPLYDALHDMVDQEKAEELIEKEVIEVAPLAFMRGRTLSNAFVILDEAQNTTNEQMKMLLTRLGPHSKCVVTGDPSQIDLPRGVQSGLVEALAILKETKGIATVRFEKKDITRHDIVARIVAAYDKHKK